MTKLETLLSIKGKHVDIWKIDIVGTTRYCVRYRDAEETFGVGNSIEEACSDYISRINGKAISPTERVFFQEAI